MRSYKALVINKFTNQNTLSPFSAEQSRNHETSNKALLILVWKSTRKQRLRHFVPAQYQQGDTRGSSLSD